MANRTAPMGGRFTGWFKDDVTPTLKYYLDGTLVMTVTNGNDLTLADKLSVAGTTLFSGVVNVGAAYLLPITDGTAGQQMGTNGSGTAAWAAAS